MCIQRDAAMRPASRIALCRSSARDETRLAGQSWRELQTQVSRSLRVSPANRAARRARLQTSARDSSFICVCAQRQARRRATSQTPASIQKFRNQNLVTRTKFSSIPNKNLKCHPTSVVFQSPVDFSISRKGCASKFFDTRLTMLQHDVC